MSDAEETSIDFFGGGVGFETGSKYIVQINFQLVILLSQILEGSNI